jgi:hypothetical protein
MKIKNLLFFAPAVMLVSLSACSKLPADSNKSVSEQAIDSTVGVDKIGIPECDALIGDLAAFAENPDDNFAARAAKRAAANKMRENLKQTIEQNKTDKTKLAKECTKYKNRLDMWKNNDPSK